MHVYNVHTPDEGSYFYLMIAYHPRRREVRLAKLAAPHLRSNKRTLSVALFERYVRGAYATTPAALRQKTKKRLSAWYTSPEFIKERLALLTPWYKRAGAVRYELPASVKVKPL